MNNSNSILPMPLRTQHIEAFDLLCQQRLSHLHLDVLLIYLINSVSPQALYYLAEQFDVLGHKGWKLADTDLKKRDLIKTAIELHRFKGTIHALKKALSALGFPNAIITEHVTHWATFNLQLNIGNNTLNPQIVADIAAVVNEYKNVRSHFLGIYFQVVFGDNVALADISSEGISSPDIDNLFVGGDFKYNGAHAFNGSRNYSNDTDVLTIQIIP